MDETKIKRIKQFSSQLRLNAMDSKDIIRYISNSYDFHAGIINVEEFSISQRKIKQLDLMHICNRFIELLDYEEFLYHDYKNQFPLKGDEEIWELIYPHTNAIIKTEIQQAKESYKHSPERIRNQNRGCIVSMWIIAFAIVILALTRC